MERSTCWSAPRPPGPHRPGGLSPAAGSGPLGLPADLLQHRAHRWRGRCRARRRTGYCTPCPPGTDTVVSTSLEAFACSVPVSGYRRIAGHGPTDAAALNEAGAAVWTRGPADLTAVRFHLIGGPLGRRQRATGFALFAQSPDGCPTAEIARKHRSGASDRGFRPAAQRHRAKRRPRRRARRRGARTAARAATGTRRRRRGVPRSRSHLRGTLPGRPARRVPGLCRPAVSRPAVGRPAERPAPVPSAAVRRCGVPGPARRPPD